MVDPVILVVIGFYYAFDMIVNLLAVIILSLTVMADDKDFKDTMGERMVTLINEDKNFYYRNSAVLIINLFALYMVFPLSLTVSIILGLGIVFSFVNMLLSAKVKNDVENGVDGE
jgi:hypothetical protein